jgi:hypothetical protein
MTDLDHKSNCNNTHTTSHKVILLWDWENIHKANYPQKIKKLNTTENHQSIRKINFHRKTSNIETFIKIATNLGARSTALHWVRSKLQIVRQVLVESLKRSRARHTQITFHSANSTRLTQLTVKVMKINSLIQVQPLQAKAIFFTIS